MHTTASRKVDSHNVLAISTKTESHAAHGVNERVGFTAVHLPSQASDIDVDDVRHRIEVQIPDVLQQHRAGNDLPGVTNEILEQLKLLRQQLDRSPLAVSSPSQQIHLQVADPQDRRPHNRRAATGECVDASEKFCEGEGLDEVVVTTSAQAANPIIDLAQGTDDESRRHDSVLSEAPDDLDTIDARQHAVNRHHNIVGNPTEHQPLAAIGSKVNLIAASSQALAQLLRRVGIVLDDQDAPSGALHGTASNYLEGSPRRAHAKTNIFVRK